jgi:serine/threonine protein kinase
VLEKDFEILETLGRGSIGVVRRARRRSDGLAVALKISQSRTCELVAVEYALLKSLDHPYIIKCYDRISLESMDCEVLVFEHFEGSTLQKLSTKVHEADEDTPHRIFLALLSAVAFLHEKDIIHRDIKADNVLVSQDLSDLRLIDFNTSRRQKAGETPLTGTGCNSWSAPEVLLGDFPGKPNDVWGIGLCLHLMVCGSLPCPQEDIKRNAYIDKVLRYASDLKHRNIEAVSEECMTTLRCCLEVDKTMRVQAHSLWQSDPFKTQAGIA